MSLTVEMTPELEVRLVSEASKRGLAAGVYARLLLERLLSPSEAEAEEAERLAAIDAALGACADASFTSDDLAREKQIDIDREDLRPEDRF